MCLGRDLCLWWGAGYGNECLYYNKEAGGVYESMDRPGAATIVEYQNPKSPTKSHHPPLQKINFLTNQQLD